jgi:Glycosyl hydrolase family 3 N terminal domain
MFRISIAIVCSCLIAAAAAALPRSIAGHKASALILVEDSVPYWSDTNRSSCGDAIDPPSWCGAYLAKLHRPQKKWAVPIVKVAPKLASYAPAGAVKTAASPSPPGEKLREMIGQLLLSGFSGREPGDPDVERIANELRTGNLAGALVRVSNIENSAQLARLLGAITGAAGQDAPLIAIEQPGGPDTGLSEDKGFAFYNSANAAGSSGTPNEAQTQYQAMAGELAALGVTLNIGPSEDACRRPGIELSAHCFGTASQSIETYAQAFKSGHHGRGVLTALRHVPFRRGLRTAWLQERPSSALLHILLKREPSDALVVGVKAMEAMPYLGASLGSARAANGQASRNTFHDALIFELDMPAGAPAIYGETIVRALQSGADMILIRDPSVLPPALAALSVDAIQRALKSGALPEARFEDACRHAYALKARLQSLQAKSRIATLNHSRDARLAVRKETP